MTPSTLDDRSLGWLRYLHRKATTPDDWSQAGQPHPHWDNRSGPPMTSWHRFDLIDSSYAVALMCDITPAWRDQLVRPHGRLVLPLALRGLQRCAVFMPDPQDPTCLVSRSLRLLLV